MLLTNADFKFHRSIYSTDHRSIEECSMEFVFSPSHEFLDNTQIHVKNLFTERIQQFSSNSQVSGIFELTDTARWTYLYSENVIIVDVFHRYLR